MIAMKKLIKYFFAVFLALAACKSEPAYQKIQVMQGSIWNRFDNQIFEVPVTETGKSYDIYLTMKRTIDYPYDELPVNVVLQTPSGEERIREFTFKLSQSIKEQEQEGADSLSSKFQLWKEVLLSDKGKCTITIENLIPKIATPGIANIGIVVKKSEEK
jgi:gliding motility-associated lipoprotein GldH